MASKKAEVRESMASKGTTHNIGGWAFIIGVLLSIFLGWLITPAAGWMMALLAVLGLLVAFLNITDKEVKGYLIANIAILAGSSAFGGMLATLGATLGLGDVAKILVNITGNLVFFVAPGAVILALKEIYLVAKEQ